VRFEEEAGFLAIGYTFVQIYPDSEVPYISKYAFTYPEHQVSVRLKRLLPFGFVSSLGAVLKKRIVNYSPQDIDESYYTLDAQVSKRIGAFLFSIKGTNLLDMPYKEISGVEMPGRWLTAGIKMQM
jgi:hypothetical protein